MAEPDLRVLSFGGGHQSTTLHLMSDAGEIERLDLSIFADTGWEPADVYEHIAWVESVSSIPIHRVSIGRNLRDDTVNWQQHEGRSAISIPAFILNTDGSKGMIQHRQCTHQYKIEPIRKHIRQVLGVQPRHRVPKGTVVEQWLGFSWDERMRVSEPRQKWIVNRHPLIDRRMTRTDCKAWFADRFPDRVLPRSACSGCPFRHDQEWLHLKQTSPADFADAVVVDASIRESGQAAGFVGTPFLNARLKPLAEAVEDYERELEINPQLPGFESRGDERMWWGLFRMNQDANWRW